MGVHLGSRVSERQWLVLGALERSYPEATLVRDAYAEAGLAYSHWLDHNTVKGLVARRAVLHLCVGHDGTPTLDCWVAITDAGRESRLKGGRGAFGAACRRMLRARRS